MEYIALFASAFAAATFLPFSSEMVLLALLEQGRSWLLLWGVASCGNTLGALVNWYLGRAILKYQQRRWFYFSQEQILKAQRWYSRYGKWSLLFTWLPIVGDVLTLVAGTMRVPPSFFVIVVGLGKCLRYLAVIALWQLAVS